MSLSGKVAVVTGAARGLGRVVAQEMAARGARMVLVDLAGADASAAELAAGGAEVVAQHADVSEETAVRALVAATRERFGHVDVLVNNAGISLLRPAEETSLAEWDRVLAVNLTSAFLCCREFGALMLERRRGAIVNVSSIAGLRAVSDRSAYNASKHGLIGLSATLAAEWGGRGVRVNAVCPGWIKTEMDAEDQASGGYSDADIEGQVPMGRFARPEDVAEAICFLADDDIAGFVNGAALPVDGGWSADASWSTLRARARSR